MERKTSFSLPLFSFALSLHHESYIKQKNTKAMKKVKFLLLALAAVLMVSCGTSRTVPLTGRKQSLMVTDDQVLSLSNQEYTQFMKTAKKSTNEANTAMVKRVGTRLANAVETYLKNNGYASEISQYQWEFNLVQNNEANAFCLPGGKIVVYEGLLPYTKTEAALAIVLGHEIAHAVAKHSAEQLSKQYKQSLGTQVASGILSAAGISSSTIELGQMVAQYGFKFQNLKYSRSNESEADHMGLIFAAMAGYDPREAIPFWQRMSSGSSNQDDFLSDHPSDAKRIAALQQEMPEALKYYKPVQTVSTTKKTTSKTRTSKSRSSLSATFTAAP